MKTLFLVLLIFCNSVAFGQRLHRFDEINNVPLTLLPTIFDPDQDSTIVKIEFLQDTSEGRTYDERIFSSIDKAEGIEKVYGVGFIRDFRIDKKTVSVIIKTYHSNGDIKSFKYTEKIDKLSYFDDFDWAMYSIDVEIFYQGTEDEVHWN